MASYGDDLKIEVTFLPHETGGRGHTPCLKGGWYRPHLVIAQGSEMLGVQFLDGPDGAVPPCQPTPAVIRLAYDGVAYDGLLVGTEFEIREGPRVVGSGRVTGMMSAAA